MNRVVDERVAMTNSLWLTHGPRHDLLHEYNSVILDWCVLGCFILSTRRKSHSFNSDSEYSFKIPVLVTDVQVH